MNKVGRIVAGSVVLLLFSPLAALSQNSKNSISIGDITLRPGMQQDVVLEKLGKDFDIKRMDKGDKPSTSCWSIRAKGEPQATVGGVRFKNGKLRNASKTWTDLYGDKGAAELARAVLGVIADLQKEGRTACTVSTYRSMEPGGELNTASVICGNKELAVQVMRGDSTESASVEETIYAY